MTERTSIIHCWTRDLTGYFIYLLLISTIGPLLFGFHLVSTYIVLTLIWS